MIKKIIHTANEQYHFNKAVKDFGHKAVTEQRTKHLVNDNPGAHPTVLGIQAHCEVFLMDEIAKGGTPFGDVHRNLQQASSTVMRDKPRDSSNDDVVPAGT